MSKSVRFRKWMAITLSVILLLPALAACSKGETNEKEKESVLRIATSMGYGADDEWFRQQFTEIFEFVNPNIKIEVIPTMDDRYRYGNYESNDPNEKPEDPMIKLKELMDGPNPPDIVMTEYDQLKELIDENRLQPLDARMTKDKFDLNDFVPAIVDGLKDLSTDGKIYALAPMFSSSALIYNRKMFDDAGVAYPTDDMTWDQVFDLGRRLTSGEGDARKYGFSFSPYQYSDLFNDMNVYIAPLELRMFDDEVEHMTVDSDQWEKVWEKVLELKKEKLLPEPPDYSKPRSQEDVGPFDHDAFLSGKVAMTIMSYGQLNEVINANKSAANIKNFTPIDWDVVTVPTHPDHPGIGGNVYMNGIMGINAKAQDADAAWKFLSFINGEDWAKVKAKSVYNLVTRAKYNEPKDGLEFNMNAFFKLKPAPNIMDQSIYRQYPNIWNVQNIGQMKFQEVVNGNKTIRQALKEWQTQGDQMLQQIKENPNGPIDMGKFMMDATAQ